nr:hypothetical protein CFP56_12038 [Quercus suber]
MLTSELRHLGWRDLCSCYLERVLTGNGWLGSVVASRLWTQHIQGSMQANCPCAMRLKFTVPGPRRSLTHKLSIEQVLLLDKCHWMIIGRSEHLSDDDVQVTVHGKNCDSARYGGGWPYSGGSQMEERVTDLRLVMTESRARY